MLSPNYNIYPSLLDKFQKYLDSEQEFEGFQNATSEGDYKRSLEEISATHEKELIDAINRVPHDPIPAADKGTCFNNLVDAIHTDGAMGCPFVYFPAVDELSGYYRTSLNGADYDFAGELVQGAAEYFAGSIPQHRCEAFLTLPSGDLVCLYGYADEIRGDKVYDIKTTTRWEFGKFERSWQRYIYPFCLVESGELPGVLEFEFTVYTWRERKGMPSNADVHREVYTYDHEVAREKVTRICERFVEWLEANRDKITDPKIFGEE